MTEPEKPDSLPESMPAWRAFVDSSVLVAICTAVGFLTGGTYLDLYYQCFALSHWDLGLPITRYLTAGLAPTVLLLVFVGLAHRDDRGEYFRFHNWLHKIMPATMDRPFAKKQMPLWLARFVWSAVPWQYVVVLAAFGLALSEGVLWPPFAVVITICLILSIFRVPPSIGLWHPAKVNPVATGFAWLAVFTSFLIVASGLATSRAKDFLRTAPEAEVTMAEGVPPVNGPLLLIAQTPENFIFVQSKSEGRVTIFLPRDAVSRIDVRRKKLP